MLNHGAAMTHSALAAEDLWGNTQNCVGRWFA